MNPQEIAWTNTYQEATYVNHIFNKEDLTINSQEHLSMSTPPSPQIFSKRSRPKDIYYAVVRQNTLFLYEDPKQVCHPMDIFCSYFFFG